MNLDCWEGFAYEQTVHLNAQTGSLMIFCDYLPASPVCTDIITPAGIIGSIDVLDMVIFRLGKNTLW